LGKKVIGFGNKNEEHEDLAREQLLYDATVEDVMEFGLIPELLGRLPVIGTLAQLDEAASGAGIDRTSQRSDSPVQEDVRDGRMRIGIHRIVPCDEIARTGTHHAKPGARGLRSILEQVMFDLMFELPELERGQKFVITDDIVLGNRKANHRDSAAA
jgi:ATP-dependent Clp protease ATP-binding subunit ClpX